MRLKGLGERSQRVAPPITQGDLPGFPGVPGITREKQLQTYRQWGLGEPPKKTDLQLLQQEVAKKESVNVALRARLKDFDQALIEERDMSTFLYQQGRYDYIKEQWNKKVGNGLVDGIKKLKDIKIPKHLGKDEFLGEMQQIKKNVSDAEKLLNEYTPSGFYKMSDYPSEINFDKTIYGFKKPEGTFSSEEVTIDMQMKFMERTK
jgi:hypothetical protein